MRSTFSSKIQGEKKWQTSQFVRNQMDHTWSKDRSIFMTPRAIKLRPMIGHASRCAGAVRRRTNPSATARTVRLDSKLRKPSIRKAPNPSLRECIAGPGTVLIGKFCRSTLRGLCSEHDACHESDGSATLIRGKSLTCRERGSDLVVYDRRKHQVEDRKRKGLFRQVKDLQRIMAQPSHPRALSSA